MSAKMGDLLRYTCFKVLVACSTCGHGGFRAGPDVSCTPETKDNISAGDIRPGCYSHQIANMKITCHANRPQTLF